MKPLMIAIQKIKLFLLTTLCLKALSAACCAEEFHDPAIDRLLEEVKAAYGVDLHYAKKPTQKFSDLEYSLAEEKDLSILKKALFLFVQEISLYPKNFFRYARCRNIYFVQKLFYEQKPVDGLFSAGPNYIFYDYSRRHDNTQKIRHSIHHELYHMIGSKHPFWKERGAQWETLNRSGFSYGRKMKPRERNPVNFYAPDEPGFITDYAMVSAEEDRAEMFACMMIPEEFRIMKQWAQKDEILFKKSEMINEFLKEAF